MKEDNTNNNLNNPVNVKDNADVFYSYDTQGKVKHFQSRILYKPILKLLKINIEDLDDPALDNLYELANNSQKFIEQTQIYNKALELFSTTSLNYLKQNLENSKFSQIIVDKVVNIFAKKVLNAVKNTSTSLSQVVMEQSSALLNPEVALKVVDILDSIISFKKTVDNNFPAISNSIIEAANNSLVSLVNIQSPLVANILQSYDLATKVKEFISCENLENNSKILRGKIVVFSQDRELSKVTNLSSKLDDLYSTKGISEESFMKLTNNVSALTKIIDQCNKDPKVVELTKKIIEVSDALPSSSAQISNKITDVQTSLIHFDQENKLSPEAQDIIKKIVEQHTKPIMEPSLSKIIKDNNLFEKTLSQQQAISQLSTLTDKVAEAFNNRNDKTTAVQLFKEKLSIVVKDNFKQIDSVLVQSVMKFPIIAKEVGLSREVESSINKLIGSSRSM